MTATGAHVMTDHETEMLAAVRDILQGGGRVRIELGISLSIKGAHSTAQIYGHNGNRWEKVGPLLLPPEGGSRPELLDVIAGLSRTDKS